MSINRVIINSSPLIVLLKSQQAQLIPQLFTEILVPSSVFEEVTTKDDVASTQLRSISWIQMVEIKKIARFSQLLANLATINYLQKI